MRAASVESTIHWCPKCPRYSNQVLTVPPASKRIESALVVPTLKAILPAELPPEGFTTNLSVPVVVPIKNAPPLLILALSEPPVYIAIVLTAGNKKPVSSSPKAA